MEDNLQTHTIPTDRPAQERLARLMGFATLDEFETAHQAHTRNVRRIFDRLLKADAREGEAASPFPRQFEGAEAEWKKLLAEHAFKDVDKAFRVLREFVEGPGYVHVSPRTSDLAHQLLPRLFALCPAAAAGVKAQRAAMPPRRQRAAFRSRPRGDAARQLHQRLRRAGDALRAVEPQPHDLRAAGAACSTARNFWRNWPFARRTWWMSW